jgi:tetratricopeptide (TPR) repeat protein
MDEISMVLLRRTPQNEPWISRFGLDCRNVQFSPPSDSGRAAQYQFHANAGAVCYALSRDKEAEQHWKQAEALFPRDPNVHIYLAQLYVQQRRLPEAEAHYVASLRSRQTATAVYGLGRLYATEHRWTEAEGAISTAAELELQPSNQYKALAQVQLHLNKAAQAEANLLKAERAGPAADDPNANEFRAQIAEGRAEVARQHGNLSQAIELQQEATRQTPQSIGRLKKLAELATAANQPSIASTATSRAQSLEAAAKP